MRDVEAQLIHDMQNTAMVIREAATRLHEHGTSMPPALAAHLTEMLARRSDMLVRLLGDLSTSHLAEEGALDLALERVSLFDICQNLLAERPGARARGLLERASRETAVSSAVCLRARAWCERRAHLRLPRHRRLGLNRAVS